MRSERYRWFLFIFLFWCRISFSACAEDSNFLSVRARLPENQYNKEKTYFDLLMEPEQEQVIQLEIENKSTEKIEAGISVSAAYTSDDGIVQYETIKANADHTLLYDMKDIVQTLSRVKIEAGEIYVLDLKIKMPEKEFDGILAGGITVETITEKYDTPEEGGSGIELVNEYSYVIGIILRENEKEIDPEMNLRYVKADNAGENTIIRVNLQNTNPVYAEDLTIEAQIREKGEKKIIYKTKAEAYKMAPNSNFDFHMDMDGQKLEAGVYTVYFNVRWGQRSWNWKEDFEMKQTGGSVGETDTARFNWIYLVAVMTVLSICLFAGVMAAKGIKR